MTFAYVLITTDPESGENVLRALRHHYAVKKAHRVYSIYDIVVEVVAESMDELKDIITQLRQISHVRSTFTMIAMDTNTTI